MESVGTLVATKKREWEKRELGSRHRIRKGPALQETIATTGGWSKMPWIPWSQTKPNHRGSFSLGPHQQNVCGCKSWVWIQCLTWVAEFSFSWWLFQPIGYFLFTTTIFSPHEWILTGNYESNHEQKLIYLTSLPNWSACYPYFHRDITHPLGTMAAPIACNDTLTSVTQWKQIPQQTKSLGHGQKAMTNHNARSKLLANVQNVKLEAVWGSRIEKKQHKLLRHKQEVDEQS